MDLKHLPLLVQQQLRILIKPKKSRTEQESASLLPLLKEVKFFKERNIAETVLQKIARIANHEF